ANRGATHKRHGVVLWRSNMTAVCSVSIRKSYQSARRLAQPMLSAARALWREALNFLVTNRIPRGLATRFMGWFSRIENPLVSAASIAAWRAFADLRLDEAKKSRFTSLHDCFIRELKEGARPVERDPSILASPCDAIVGASGRVEGTRLFQAKGFHYHLGELIGEAAYTYRDAAYVTLRITSSMYHRFHAPHDLRVERVTYFSGDTWNVNPIALKR